MAVVTSAGVPGRGVSTRKRSPTSAPDPTSTRPPLMPVPPTSMPSARLSIAGSSSVLSTTVVWSVIVEINDWFAEYLDAFAAACRGDTDTSSLLAYFAVPLLLTTDGGFYVLTSDEQVVGGVGPQVDQMHAAGFHHNEVSDAEITVLNATSALYRGTISRKRADGGEINRITATYLLTDGPVGRRVSVLAVHSA